MNRLTGKVAVITGGNSGIGEATAKLFAAEGAKVVIAARRENELKRVADEIKTAGGECTYAVADVTVDEDAPRVIKLAIDTYGKIDILVNNAGIADAGAGILYTSEELWAKCTAVNETAVFIWSKAALGYMKEQDSGAIVNVASIGGLYGIAGAAYSASKRACIGLTKNIAYGFVGGNVRCNCVCPGETETPMIQNMPESLDPELDEIIGRQIDLEHFKRCEAKDIANAILFFSCDDSVMCNGQVLTVDGGMCL